MGIHEFIGRKRRAKVVDDREKKKRREKDLTNEKVKKRRSEVTKEIKIDVYKKMNVSGKREGNKKQEHEGKNIRGQAPPTDKNSM